MELFFIREAVVEHNPEEEFKLSFSPGSGWVFLFLVGLYFIGVEFIDEFLKLVDIDRCGFEVKVEFQVAEIVLEVYREGGEGKEGREEVFLDGLHLKFLWKIQLYNIKRVIFIDKPQYFVRLVLRSLLPDWSSNSLTLS